MPAPLRIAFLGTGLMGAQMARRLLGAGFNVTVWNRSREKAEALGVDGARISDAATDAVSDAHVVITMLTDGPAVTDTLFAPAASQRRFCPALSSST